MRRDLEQGLGSGSTAHKEKAAMMGRLKNTGTWIVAVSLIAVAFLAACETTVSRAVIPELSFKHLPALSFAVGRIEVVENYRSPLRAPHVEHLFPIPISAALKRWSDDRLVAEGGTDVMRVIVEDASAVTEELETNKDLEGLFTNEQAERVDARLQVRIEITDENGEVLAFTNIEAVRSRTTPENVSLSDRDQIYNDLTMVVMNDFNTSQEQELRRYFEKFLR